MTGRARTLSGVLLATATAIAVAGCEVESDTAGEATMDTTRQDTVSQSRELSSEMYEAQLEARAESGVEGTATFTVEDNELVVTIAATGLDPSTQVPQHIHMNATCDDAGGIVLNLDDQLSLPNDGDPRGEAYPQSDAQGALRYEARRSVGELRMALAGTGPGGAASDTAAASSDTLRTGSAGMNSPQGAATAGLDLTGHVVNLHAADMSVIACGPIEAMDHGQMTAGATTPGNGPGAP